MSTRSFSIRSLGNRIAFAAAFLGQTQAQTFDPATHGQWGAALGHSAAGFPCSTQDQAFPPLRVFNAIHGVLISKDTSTTGTNLRGWVFVMGGAAVTSTGQAQIPYAMINPETNPPTFINQCVAMPGPNQRANPQAPLPRGDLFCSHHVTMRDGAIFFAGGVAYDTDTAIFHGSDLVYTWDPGNWNVPSANNGWAPQAALAQRRYYPMVVVGQVLAGLDRYYIDGGVDLFQNYPNNVPSTYEAYYRTGPGVTAFDADLSQVRIYAGPSQTAPVPSTTFHWYPWLHLLTTGQFFMSGFAMQSGKATHDPLNVSPNWAYAAGQYTYGGLSLGWYSHYGSSVLQPINLNVGTPTTNRIMRIGGLRTYGPTQQGQDVLREVQTCDANPAGSSSWSGPMLLTWPRMYCNAVILFDGTILVVGGVGPNGFVNTDSELIVGTLRTSTPPMDPRGYHSIAILLPDGRVLVGGGNGRDSDYQFYSPPYLFKGPRPVITSTFTAPLSYGTTGHSVSYMVDTETPDYVAKVVLIRPGSTTHHFDSEQRYLELHQVTNPPPPAGTIQFDTPPNSNYAPPGIYMLVLITNTGIPSKAAWVQLQ